VFVYYGSINGLGGTPWTLRTIRPALSSATAFLARGREWRRLCRRGGGAPYYDNGQTDEGRALIYLGGNTGVIASPSWTGESNQASARFGASAAAGDVNGDGYADLVAGAPYYDDGQTDEGIAYLYYGNGVSGVRLAPGQFQATTNTLIGPLGVASPNSARTFDLRAWGRIPYGRGSVKLEWEVKPWNVPFDGTSLQRSANWVDILVDGAQLSAGMGTLSEYTAYHWRVRLVYNPATTPFQSYSRWITIPNNGWNEADVRTRDVTAPTSQSHNLSGTMGSSNWYTSPVTVTLSAADNPGGVGLDRIEYRLNGCVGEWLVYQPPLVAAESRAYELCYRAVDEMDNHSDPVTQTFWVDVNPPATIATPSDTPWRENWYRSDPLTVTLTATDTNGESGVQTITYQVDGGDWIIMTDTLIVAVTLSGPLTHTLAYRSQDEAGNWEVEQTLTVRLDAQAPVVSGQLRRRQPGSPTLARAVGHALRYPGRH
jgi:hypothetical protein